jgi:P27 family predicted phage terminase small subunit
MAANDAAAQAGGGKHWTKAEREARTMTEVKPAKPETKEPPAWVTNPPDILTDAQDQKLFRKIAKQLLALDVGFCQMDTDFLAWYIQSKRQFDALEPMVLAAAQRGDVKNLSSIVKTRNTLFTQCRACANELGMTINSRCHLVAAPAKQEEPDPLAELREQFARKKQA